MKSRNLRFLLTVISVLLLLYVYMAWSLGRGLEHPPIAWLLAAIPVLGIITYPILYFSSRRRADALKSARTDNKSDEILSKAKASIKSPTPMQNPRPSFAQWVAYFSMAGASFLLPLVILRDFLIFSTRLFAPNVSASLLGGDATLLIPLVSIGLLAIGIFTAARGLQIKRMPILFESRRQDAAAALNGFRIAQITDLHIGPTIDHHYVQNVVDKTNSVDPDVVVLTGDIGDGDPSLYAKDFAPLKGLRAKHGVYFVTGNHEYYSNGTRWMEIMSELGMKVLKNENQIFTVTPAANATSKSSGATVSATVAIAGVLDPAAAMISATDGPNPEKAVRGCETSDYKILLAHQPGIADRAEKAGFDLQISGHTHGGQFFPWNLVVKKVHEYHQGLFKRNGMHIYVSPGTGSWGPPVRLGTRPEISVLTLLPSM